ncbi:MAG: 2-oxoacid:ferredoxin oxidoreductase subunit beta [Candidatus Aphodosoma sp.]
MYTAKDYKSDQYVRWCPGCGDHAVLNSLQKAMAEIGIPPHQIAVISGIGCSSRLPHYMNTYGFNTIHGRGAAIASGVKVANPQLTVWQASGDGDCLAIGGNHFIHAIRRNVDINLIIFNNRIYGLTKGQYSPTSPKGFVSKSSPFGTVERPFRPAELVMGARGTFFARSLDVDQPTSLMVLKAAEAHKGYSVCEFLTNCVIFNNGTHGWIATKEDRMERTVLLEHGKPMIFGKDRNKGLVLDGWNLKVVTIGENGVKESDILVHDAKCEDTTLHLKLALMDGPDMPIAMGVIRDVDCETYDVAVTNQIKEVQSKSKYHTFDELIGSLEQWDM